MAGSTKARQSVRRGIARRPAARGSAAGEYLALLARILAASGYSRRTLKQGWERAWRSLPQHRGPARELSVDEVLDLPHVLAHWHTDPGFLDTTGRPRALPLRGRYSLETLIRRVFPHAALTRLVRALERNEALSRRGSLYRPRGRAIRYGTQDARLHGLAALLGLLRTLEHNVSAGAGRQRLFERSATNSRVPVRFMRTFAQRVHQQALPLLFSLDTDLKRFELAARPGEPTAHVGVGIYLFEHPSETGGTRGAPDTLLSLRAGR